MFGLNYVFGLGHSFGLGLGAGLGLASSLGGRLVHFLIIILSLLLALCVIFVLVIGSV